MSTGDREKTPHLELFELLGALARRRYQAAERAFAPLGLNHTEGRLLSMLEGEGGAATQDSLSRRLTVDRSNAGRAFKRLEAAGYVERRRDDADARAYLVGITPKGREAAAEVDRLRGEIARTFFEELSEADAARAIALLTAAAR
jgi:MarR family transcriptional regulator for hemolysin